MFPVVVFRHTDNYLLRYWHRVRDLAGAGADETKLTREALKWPYGEFEIPEEVYDTFSAAGKKGQALEEEWNKVTCVLKCSQALRVTCSMLQDIECLEMPKQMLSLVPEMLFSTNSSVNAVCFS